VCTIHGIHVPRTERFNLECVVDMFHRLVQSNCKKRELRFPGRRIYISIQICNNTSHGSNDMFISSHLLPCFVDYEIN